MHVTLVEINVHEDKVDEFIEVFRQNHLGSVQEEGNLRFDVLQDPEVNSRFYIYEALMNPLMILVKIIKLRWIHILSYDQ
ncbi:antibiotic biosynthesis monooxygenase, partial [Escherichia coli]|nr:antibiotic biosynthesis monooxygenase [Escherichia coli]